MTTPTVEQIKQELHDMEQHWMRTIIARLRAAERAHRDDRGPSEADMMLGYEGSDAPQPVWAERGGAR